MIKGVKHKALRIILAYKKILINAITIIFVIQSFFFYFIIIKNRELSG